MYRHGWIIFAVCFILSELIFRKKTAINSALRGFSGGCLISLACFFLAPGTFSGNLLLTGLLMLAGAAAGECLVQMGACGTALWFICFILLVAGFIFGLPFIQIGGGFLLYMGCMLALPENINGREKIISRGMGAIGFVFITVLGFL